MSGAELCALLDQEIPEGRQSLQESHVNLERVAEYCETNYYQAENKRAALEETKNYTTQSLASVAYQINTLAFNFLQMLDLQTNQMAEMESEINHISQMIMIHKEKVARREIGVLTTNKTTSRQHKIIAPANPERPIKYIRKPIDYGALDDIGHGVKLPGVSGGSSTPRVAKQQPRPVAATQQVVSGPAPTTKPPTPPQMARGATGSLSKGSRDYRTLAPPVAPPQVPSNYAANYPMGHPRAHESRRSDRTSGYGSLPLAGSHYYPGSSQSQHSATLPSNATMAGMGGPQIGTVHPLNMADHVSHYHQMMSHYGGSIGGHYGAAIQQQGPPPTPPPPPAPAGTDPSAGGRPASPPLPPPPPESEEQHHGFMGVNYVPPSPHLYHATGRGGVYHPAQQGGPVLPEWAPPNYLEKVVAIYDYAADKDDELSFSENSVIFVVKKNDDGWYEGVMDGITGLFPGNYVEPCL